MPNNAQQHPILYSFRRCPYAMRGRMGIAGADLTVELREIILRDKPVHMLDISPKGTVPVLFLPDGTVIDESLDIMLWALSQNDPNGWLDGDNLPLIEESDTRFKPLLDRYKYPSRYPDEDCTQAREGGLAFLRNWNARIAKNGFLLRDTATLADIAIFPFVRQFAHVDRDWFYGREDIPALQNWLQRHLQSDLFTRIMKKYPQWKDGDDVTLFPPHLA